MRRTPTTSDPQPTSGTRRGRPTTSGGSGVARKARSEGNGADLDLVMRDQILQIALDLFADHGFEAVGLADIARRAGVSPSLLSYYFSSKLDLWKAALTLGFGTLVADIGAAISFAKDVPPEYQLRIFLRSFTHLVSQHLLAFKLAVSEQHIDSPRLRWLETEFLDPVFSYFAPLLERAQRSGAIRGNVPIHSLYPILTGSVLQFLSAKVVLQRFGNLDPTEPDAIARHADLLSEALFSGLSTHA